MNAFKVVAFLVLICAIVLISVQAHKPRYMGHPEYQRELCDCSLNQPVLPGGKFYGNAGYHQPIPGGGGYGNSGAYAVSGSYGAGGNQASGGY